MESLLSFICFGHISGGVLGIFNILISFFLVFFLLEGLCSRGEAACIWLPDRYEFKGHIFKPWLWSSYGTDVGHNLFTYILGRIVLNQQDCVEEERPYIKQLAQRKSTHGSYYLSSFHAYFPLFSYLLSLHSCMMTTIRETKIKICGSNIFMDIPKQNISE